MWDLFLALGLLGLAPWEAKQGGLQAASEAIKHWDQRVASEFPRSLYLLGSLTEAHNSVEIEEVANVTRMYWAGR